MSHYQKEWVRYNELTGTYDTRDGTKVAAELVENAASLLDIFYIAFIRKEKRENIKKENGFTDDCKRRLCGA